MRFSPLLTGLMGANLVLLAGALGLVFLYKTDVMPVPVRDSFSLEAEAPGAVLNKTSADYALLSEKPLFHATRKPVEITKPEPVQARPQVVRSNLTDYLLTGIVYISSGESLAYVRGRRNGKNYKLRLGDEFEGWTVEEIRKTEVVVSRDGRRETLPLIKKN
ncbi:type II secretion system protein N [Emcibacter nanhaiensis]|uniref:Type II secretion system protein GspC N-terminal domain-containing protein n=1 Tax=Emcibacter nanhaiensis TaxID=1505037 RepID=A0A501PEV6_9PROT|nr:type II secretion system protein N [Emcibacter nanhaiensis]TPD58979.1 hypothetical protein FIV46_12140 [Emcibacter nanhaiensis]